MGEQRDPRKDPRPGDVLRDENGMQFVSEQGEAGVAFFRVGWKRPEWTTLGSWIAFSATDEVIHVAD